ncbi:MAG TPA: iron-sulfur cluster repair di-iron protein [Armatimonadota bacterium]|jgi:regulator of cell morphogenesis and NO signaling
MEKMTVTPDMTVGAVVAEFPATLQMFESLGIDYCCGGKRTLADAAQATQMPVEALLAVLRTTIAQSRQTPAVAREWQDAPLDELLDHILTVHHAFMRHELPRITQLMERVARSHGEKHGATLTPLAETYQALRSELEAHLTEEEERIFPMIRRVLTGTVDAEIIQAVSTLEHEHESAGVALARLRTLTQDYQAPTGACTTYCALYDALQALERDLHQHIHLENNILFQRTRQLVASKQEAA